MSENLSIEKKDYLNEQKRGNTILHKKCEKKGVKNIIKEI